jgi:hypothetical protein
MHPRLTRKRVRTLAVSVLLLTSWQAAEAAGGTSASLTNDRVRVEAEIAAGQLRERYLARRDREWVRVAEAISPVAIVDGEGKEIPVAVRSVAADATELSEEFLAGGIRIERTVRLTPGNGWIRVATSLTPSPAARLHRFVDRFVFALPADWSYAPSVGGFVPDAQYKAPVVMVQAGRTAFGIVPDLRTLDRATLKRCSHALDLDARGAPQLAVGFVPAHMARHSVYEEDKAGSWLADGTVVNAYYLMVTATAEPGAAYRDAVRFHWGEFGRPAQRLAAEQQRGTPTAKDLYDWIGSKRPVPQQVETDRRFPSLALWDDWRDVVWRVQTQENWLELPLPGGAIGGGVWTHRWGPGPAIYLSAWFNTLRTSLGQALYARRIGDPALLAKAKQTVEVALRAPGVEGAFKCVGVRDDAAKRVVWAAGDGTGAGVEEGFLGYDMSWTAYWLLRWAEAGLVDRETVLPRCRALAQFFVERQMGDGMLPTRFAEDGSVLVDPSRMVKAETGPVALFLLELHAVAPDPRWLRGAVAGLRFLDEHVVPRREWHDFETFWSCSPRDAGFDERSGQSPANDLALGQAVAAYLAAYRATGDQGYLARGESLLDYLLLYQQVWTNPAIEGVTGPTLLLGGFTTQNSDAEWSDARQSQFGNVLIDYYRATGKAEYLERGVAALRSQFPVSPAENWAHSGLGPKSGISSFHWGTGSGMAGIELEEDFLRDAVVDVATGVAVGVNGLNVTRCKVAGDTIELEIGSPFRWNREPVAIFHGAEARRAYRVVVNGAELGSKRGEELARGLKLPRVALR